MHNTVAEIIQTCTYGYVPELSVMTEFLATLKKPQKTVSLTEFLATKKQKTVKFLEILKKQKTVSLALKKLKYSESH